MKKETSSKDDKLKNIFQPYDDNKLSFTFYFVFVICLSNGLKKAIINLRQKIDVMTGS